MKSDEIKQAVANKGYTLSMIAEALGLDLSSVSGVVCGHTKSKRVAEAVAKIIEKPVHEVFPEVDYSRPKVVRGDERKQSVSQLRAFLLAS
ncbi:helix-turn-helix domain-containing protein [Pseudoalteromonas xiamenensis]